MGSLQARTAVVYYLGEDRVWLAGVQKSIRLGEEPSLRMLGSK